jgi:hypothetical protein
MKLTSTDTSKRKSAKNELKSKLLDEFKSVEDLNAENLKGFKPLFNNIGKAFK